MSRKPAYETRQIDRLRAATAEANIPTLLLTLVQLTGDRSWLTERYRISRPIGVSDNDTGGFALDVQGEIRSAATQAIERYLAGAPVAWREPNPDDVIALLQFSVGEPIPVEYGPMLVDDMRAAGIAAASSSPSVDISRWDVTGAVPTNMSSPPPGFRIGIVGAGISGLTAAMALEHAGIDYQILEAHQSVGGSWLENHYPGAGVDTPVHLYSWPGLRHEWPRYFALRDDVMGYLREVAEERVPAERITFGARVIEASFDEQQANWRVKTNEAAGANDYTFDVLISAVGLFNTPSEPKIPGGEEFTGRVFHTARWPDDLDITGLRVAVVGSGASAMQVVPAIADDVEKLYVIQRTPQWIAPFEKFHQRVPDAVRDLMDIVPEYAWWYRVRLMWMFNDRFWDSLEVDPEWPHQDRSINRSNEGTRRYFLSYLERELRDRPDLLEKVVPSYPPYVKRILFDNGWYQTLRKPSVELVAEGVVALNKEGVVTSSGRTHPVDIVVYATGFEAVKFLSTFTLIGRDGVNIRDLWGDDDARAYLGTVVPGFPNFFCMYGPNLQAGHGGSFMTTAGAQVTYIMSLLDEMFRNHIATVDCRQEVCDEYNYRVDRANATRIWTHPGATNYYRNKRGRVVVNRAFKNLDFWEWTRVPHLDEFHTRPRSDGDARTPSQAIAGNLSG
jgi:4-hydroxyacetophenone monooxygenase